MTRDEIEDGVREARLTLAIVAAIASDLLEKGNGLKPRTKTQIGDALREYQRDGY